MENTTQFLEKHGHAGYGLSLHDVFTAWVDDIDPEQAHHLRESGLLHYYWLESFICLGEDPDYGLMGDAGGADPDGYPADVEEALRKVGIRPMHAEGDAWLWGDLVSHGHVEVFHVEGDVVAYYKHPMLEDGVPYHLTAVHPHRPHAAGEAHAAGPMPC